MPPGDDTASDVRTLPQQGEPVSEPTLKTPASSIDLETEEAEPGTLVGGARVAAESWDVFISYRIKSDEPLAEAFRDLLEGSVTPKPRVFVASSGGLRPSQTGYKKQIQLAAQDARAFVAIITPTSIDREWLFFEAGAAWGRDQLYAPLLVDTEPSQLPTTIADYQATRSTQDKEVETLVDSIAETLGRQTRGRFAPRYRTFRRAIDDARQPDLRPDPDDDEPFAQGLMHALAVDRSGNKRSALQIFDGLRSDALDIDQRALLELLAIGVRNRGKTIGKELGQIEKLPEPLRSSPRVLYALSNVDPSPALQIAYLEKVVSELPDGHPVYPLALDRLVTRYVNVGKVRESDDLTRRYLLGASRPLKGVAAAVWARIHIEAPSALRLLLLCWSYSIKPTAEVAKAAVELATDTNWWPLSIYLGRRWQGTDPSSDSIFQLGRAYTGPGLTSLAYECYARAADEGVAVAKLNMASLVGRKPVPAAALRLLESHVGDWNCVPPSTPFEFRGGMITEVATERERSDGLNSNGESQFSMIVDLAELSVSDPAKAASRDDLAGQVLLKPTTEPGKLEVVVPETDSANADLIAMPLIPGLYEVRAKQQPTFGIAWLDRAGLVIVRLDREGQFMPSRLRYGLKS